MHDASQNNAMAEIALALATAFFSIMVLTMVSMGAGFASSTQVSVDAGGLALRAPVESDRGAHEATEEVSADALIVHYRDHFLDAGFSEIDPNATERTRPTVLAISPDVSMAAAAGTDRTPKAGVVTSGQRSRRS